MFVKRAVNQRKNLNMHKSLTGFTLVETIVSVAVLMLAITPALFTAYKSISLNTFSQKQIIAFYLAQEATEYIRNKRDTNVLNDRNWIFGLDECIKPLFCMIDTSAPVLADQIKPFVCPGGDCPELFLSFPLAPPNDVRFYNHRNLGEQTTFIRSIQIEEIPGVILDQELIIDVNIEWTHGKRSRSFPTRLILLNWQTVF